MEPRLELALPQSSVARDSGLWARWSRGGSSLSTLSLPAALQLHLCSLCSALAARHLTLSCVPPSPDSLAEAPHARNRVLKFCRFILPYVCFATTCLLRLKERSVLRLFSPLQHSHSSEMIGRYGLETERLW